MNRLLVPVAIVVAGMAIGVGIALSGGSGDSSTNNSPTPATPPAQRDGIASEEAGRRFGSLAATRQLAGAYAVTSADCRPAPEENDGRFRCVLRFIAPSSTNPSRAPEVYEVSFRSAGDTEPTYSNLGRATPEDLQAASAPTDDGLSIPGSAPCGDKMTVKGMNCGEAQRLGDRIGRLDDGTLGVDAFRCEATDENPNVTSCKDGSKEFRYFATA